MHFSRIPYGNAQSAMFRLLQGFGDDAGRIVDKINDPNSGGPLVERIVKIALTGGYEPSTNHIRARQIMGKNFFGPDDAIKHFGIRPTLQQFGYLAEIPFSKEVLTVCKDTHILVAVFPISIIDIWDKVKGIKLPSGQKAFFYKQDWYNGQAFAGEKGELGWQLVRKTPADNSLNRYWNQQQKLLGKEDETPKVQVMVYTIIGHFLSTSERLFQEVSVRTYSVVSIASAGDRVCVGTFGADGLVFYNYWDDNRAYNLGVASAQKQ